MRQQVSPKQNKLNVSAARLRKYRKLHHMTQAVLSEKSGVSESLINKLERGACPFSVETAQKLALALQVDPEFLLGKTPNPNNKNFVIPKDYLHAGDEKAIERFLLLEETDRQFVQNFIRRLYEMRIIEKKAKPSEPF